MGCYDRPADRPQDRAVRTQRDPGATSVTSRDAARSGSDADLRRHRRPACVEAATQPLDGCAAGMRKSRGAGRTPTRACTVLDLRWCPRGGSSSLTLQPLRMCPGIRDGHQRSNVLNPSTGSRSGKALVPRGTDHRESRARSVRPLRVGDGPSKFLGGKRWKKPETASIIAGRPGEWKASDGEIAPLSPHCLLRCDNDATGPGQRLVPPYAAGEDAAQPQPQQRPVPVHFGASQRLLASPDLLTPAFPVPGV